MTQLTPELKAVIDQAQRYIDSAKEAAADGLSVSEFGFLFVGLMRLIVAGVDTFPLGGAAKKQYVMDCSDLLFEAVADKCVPFHLYPVWVVLRPGVRAIVLSAAAGAVEQLIPLVRSAK